MNIILMLVLVLGSAVPQGQTLDTLSLGFERKVVQGDYVEIIKGIAYYQAPHKVFIKVEDPIKQIMIVDDDVMTIYYPVEKKAFRIKARGPISMPFVQTILSVTREDYGLSEMGYTLGKHEKKGDTLYTYWNPPRKLKKHVGEFILGTSDGLLIYAEARGPKGKTAAKSFYRKHKELGGRHFPLEVRSEIYSGANLTEEYVSYTNVKFHITIPDEVSSFKIPHSTPIKEVEW